jgi:hypothetical protein
MSDEPKKRTRAWIWWTVALLVLYPLSMVPACETIVWLNHWGISAAGLNGVYLVVYAPVIWILSEAFDGRPTRFLNDSLAPLDPP